jgi:hypothetical protein
MTSILSAMVVFDERRAINRLAIKVALVHHQLTEQFSREWLESTLRRHLRGIDVPDDRRLTLAIKAVEAADAGDEITDTVLREVGSELIERPTGRPGDGQILAYLQRAVRRERNKRKRGRTWYDDWYRNIAICILVDLACREFDVAPTRNRECRRGNQRPSGISLVVAALARNKIHIEERTVQRHIWHGLPGELHRWVVATRLPELFV